MRYLVQVSRNEEREVLLVVELVNEELGEAVAEARGEVTLANLRVRER